jgi:hypothetical protein
MVTKTFVSMKLGATGILSNVRRVQLISDEREKEAAWENPVNSRAVSLWALQASVVGNVYVSRKHIRRNRLFSGYFDSPGIVEVSSEASD